MRRLLVVITLLLPSLLLAQTPPPPQTARQALIEMFFGTAPDHLQKHLLDATRKAFNKMSTGDGMNTLEQLSMLSSMAKAGGTKLETFDTGPTLLQAEDPRDGGKIEIAVERDDLSGDEDQIEIALHMTKAGKEEVLPFTPRVTFAMKMESEIWRLSDISFTVHLPLGDPDFLKRIQEQQNTQTEQTAKWGLQSIVTAENSYHVVHGNYACSFSDLNKVSKESADGKSATVNMLAGDLASGKRGGYIFAISGCDGNEYKVVAEPQAPNSGQRAYCADESGKMRSSADGKATTCLRSGETVEEKTHLLVAPPAASSSATLQSSHPPQRVRVSQGVTQGLIISKVQPVYPVDARLARIQGSVILKALISETGDIANLDVLSGHPMLVPAAMDAVKQWKYRPYLLQGKPLQVETQITVNFTLSGN